MRATTSRMKLLVVLLFLLCLGNVCNLMTSARNAPDKQTTQVKRNKTPFQNISETTFPKINNIKFGKPAAGKPCRVQANISIDADKVPARITSVKLIYYIKQSYDKPNEIPMTKGGGNKYTATIPGFKSGTRVDFIIRAEDSNGNVATQAVPSAKILVAGIPDDENYSESVIESLDLLNLFAGYDKKYIYVQCKLKGEITPGAQEPPLAHVYTFKFTNPDVDPKENLYTGKAVCNIPMAVSDTAPKEEDSHWIKVMGSKQKFLKAKRTGTVFFDIKDAFAQKSDTAFPDVDFTSRADGNVFSAKISRAAFGKNPSGYLRIVSFTSMNKSLYTFFPLYINCSNYLVLYTSSQSYTVK